MASSEKEAVREVVQKYIDGTYHGDVKALRECFHPSAVMNGYLGDQLLLGNPEPFFEEMEKNPPMAEAGAPYKGEITSVDVVGNIASVTLKESGFAGSMNFTDYFHLIKVEGEWKIFSKTFATEP
ncbi:MAG: nuclear transport factor 2 family protein [Deltaproteobacteria bacterium]|nr:nuclear transport factor 2 family protein [Deltaproteobacteria bacterium]